MMLSIFGLTYIGVGPTVLIGVLTASDAMLTELNLNLVDYVIVTAEEYEAGPLVGLSYQFGLGLMEAMRRKQID